MRLYLLLLLFIVEICSAQDWRNGDAFFSTKPNRKETLTVSWMIVANVQGTCEAVSKKNGLGGFGFALNACSFWRENTCLIITSNQTTMHQIGHELRHCYQGSFH